MTRGSFAPDPDEFRTSQSIVPYIECMVHYVNKFVTPFAVEI